MIKGYDKHTEKTRYYNIILQSELDVKKKDNYKFVGILNLVHEWIMMC